MLCSGGCLSGVHIVAAGSSPIPCSACSLPVCAAGDLAGIGSAVCPARAGSRPGCRAHWRRIWQTQADGPASDQVSLRATPDPIDRIRVPQLPSSGPACSLSRAGPVQVSTGSKFVRTRQCSPAHARAFDHAFLCRARRGKVGDPRGTARSRRGWPLRRRTPGPRDGCHRIAQSFLRVPRTQPARSHARLPGGSIVPSTQPGRHKPEPTAYQGRAGHLRE